MVKRTVLVIIVFSAALILSSPAARGGEPADDLCPGCYEGHSTNPDGAWCLTCHPKGYNVADENRPEEKAGEDEPLILRARVPGIEPPSADSHFTFRKKRTLPITELEGTTHVFGFLLMFGVHELGHVLEAGNSGTPIRWADGKLLAYTNDQEKLSRIAGAGLIYQNLLGGPYSFLPVESGLARSIRVASALNRLGYIAFPKSLLGDAGDVDSLEKRGRGGDILKGSLVISALVDLYKAYKPDDSWDINFWQSSSGVPGLEFVYRM